jgi:hypothetical protein
VNAYLKEITGLDITAKDFRTWAGTVLAALALRERRSRNRWRPNYAGSSPPSSPRKRRCWHNLLGLLEARLNRTLADALKDSLALKR